MFTGNGVHHFIGRKQSAEKVEVPDFSHTKWTHVFIQSKKKKRMLPKNSVFLYCKGTILLMILNIHFIPYVGAPLYPIDTYSALYVVNEQHLIVDFAEKKIPGFNLLMGFGYFELTSDNDKRKLKFTSKIIIMVRIKN